MLSDNYFPFQRLIVINEYYDVDHSNKALRNIQSNIIVYWESKMFNDMILLLCKMADWACLLQHRPLFTKQCLFITCFAVDYWNIKLNCVLIIS